MDMTITPTSNDRKRHDTYRQRHDRPSCSLVRMVSSLLVVLVVATSPISAQPPTASQLKLAARKCFQNDDITAARLHLRGLLDRYRGMSVDDRSERGRSLWSQRLAEVTHEFLRADQMGDVLELLGEAADLDVPFRKDCDNGLASVAGGLSRRLNALSSDERYDLLREWSMPAEFRRTVRMLVSFVPNQSPPPVFARALGERPRDRSFTIAGVGEVSGLFSTAWELVLAADDAGRLRQLIADLRELVEQGHSKRPTCADACQDCGRRSP